MSCKNCTANSQQDVQGELTIAFPHGENLNLPPIYIPQSALVCAACGYAEFVVPTAELEKLRKGLQALNSKIVTVS
jgi:hypothetical protein